MPGQYDSNGVTMTETASTLTNTTVSIAANAKRRGVIVSNPSDTVMTLRIGGTADANTGIVIAAGSALSFRDSYVPTAALSLFCAGTSKAYTIYEW
jgi:hypothetical protein